MLYGQVSAAPWQEFAQGEVASRKRKGGEETMDYFFPGLRLPSGGGKRNWFRDCFSTENTVFGLYSKDRKGNFP